MVKAKTENLTNMHENRSIEHLSDAARSR